MKNTTEPLKLNSVPKQGSTTDRIIAVQGEQFWRDFIAGTIIPVRREMTMMVIASSLQNPAVDMEIPDLIQYATDVADEFCLREKASLAKRVKEYFELYMERGDLDQILKVAIDTDKDYSV